VRHGGYKEFAAFSSSTREEELLRWSSGVAAKPVSVAAAAFSEAGGLRVASRERSAGQAAAVGKGGTGTRSTEASGGGKGVASGAGEEAAAAKALGEDSVAAAQGNWNVLKSVSMPYWIACLQRSRENGRHHNPNRRKLVNDIQQFSIEAVSRSGCLSPSMRQSLQVLQSDRDAQQLGLSRLFNEIDLDGSGTLDKRELWSALATLGLASDAQMELKSMIFDAPVEEISLELFLDMFLDERDPLEDDVSRQSRLNSRPKGLTELLNKLSNRPEDVARQYRRTKLMDIVTDPRYY
jgi:hypothetical protein